jgi:Na+/melibiose symporter-like transporter
MLSEEINRKLEELSKREAALKMLSYFFLSLLIVSIVAASYEYYYSSSLVFLGVSTILYSIAVTLSALLAIIASWTLEKTRKLIRSFEAMLAEASRDQVSSESGGRTKEDKHP